MNYKNCKVFYPGWYELFLAVQYVQVVFSARFGLFFPRPCMVFSQAYSDSTQLKAQGGPLNISEAISQCSSLYSVF